MKTKKIFVVEDDHGIREVIGLILSEDPYQVVMCPTAKDFLNDMQKEVPDIILMDIMLPDGNGIDLCRKIKECDGAREIPVLLMSAHFNDQANISHADAFIAKPFDISELKSTVQKYLNEEDM